MHFGVSEQSFTMPFLWNVIESLALIQEERIEFSWWLESWMNASPSIHQLCEQFVLFLWNSCIYSTINWVIISQQETFTLGFSK